MGYCTVDGCEREAKGQYCAMHRKRAQRRQELSAPAKERPSSPREWLREAALRYAEAETDAEYARADDNLRKAAASCGPVERELAIADAFERLRTRWERLGRPRRLTPEEAQRMVHQSGGVARAAAALGVSVRTVQRALRQAERTLSHTS
jgi:hypothetical protein